MKPEALPDDIVRFVQQRIDSVPQLEALILIWEGGGKAWTAAEIAARVYVTEEQAARLLQELERRELLQRAGDGYVCDPPSPLREDVVRVVGFYRRDLVRIAQLIHSKASAGVREFARAFEIKKER